MLFIQISQIQVWHITFFLTVVSGNPSSHELFFTIYNHRGRKLKQHEFGLLFIFKATEKALSLL